MLLSRTARTVGRCSSIRAAVTLIGFLFCIGSTRSQNGTIQTTPPPEPAETLDYKPCFSNDDCGGECVECSLCQCHAQSVDGKCPDRCGVPGAEVSELQGLFFSNGTMDSDPAGCSALVAYEFVGRRFRRTVVQVYWQPEDQFGAGQQIPDCGNAPIQWGDFIMDNARGQITLRFFENTALGYTPVTGSLSSACPDALFVQWTGRSRPEKWMRATEPAEHSTSPVGIWEGRMNVFGTVCAITVNIRSLLAESNIFYWDAFISKCEINFEELPVFELEDENEDEGDGEARRRLLQASSRWMDVAESPADGEAQLQTLIDDEGLDALPAEASPTEAAGEAVLAFGIQAVDDVASFPSRRSGGRFMRIFTNYSASLMDYENFAELPQSNCTRLNKFCPVNQGSTCQLRRVKPEIANVIVHWPATAEANFTVYLSEVECVCPQLGFIVQYDELGSGACEDLNECEAFETACDANTDCTNTAGSYECPCKLGFNRTGGPDAPCQNVDECEKQLDNCDVFAVCADTVGSFTCQCPIGFTGDGTECVTQSTVGFEDARPIGTKIAFRTLWDIGAETNVTDVIGLFKGWTRQISWLYMSGAGCPTQSECLGAECILVCHTPTDLHEPRYSHEFVVNSAGPGVYVVKYYSRTLARIIATATMIVNGSNPATRWRIPPDAREQASGGLADCSGSRVGARCRISVPLGGGVIELPNDSGTPVPIEFIPRCGDGRLTRDWNETCDDGNNEDGDGCSAICELEPDSACATLVNPDMSYDEVTEQWNVVGDADSQCVVYVCSDGERNALAERCDDSNLRNGDGCSSECTVEPGYDCERVDRLDTAGNIIGTFERCIPFILWLQPHEQDGCPPCHPLGSCVLWKGEKNCYCYDGYARNFSTDGTIDNPLANLEAVAQAPHFCGDINECEGDGIGKDICSANAVCTNTIGSFVCGCPSGFFGSGYGTSGICTDIDECSGPVCAPNAICTNTQGSYSCDCTVGKSGGGRATDGLCKDIDECEIGTHDCGDSQICVNWGGEDFPTLNQWDCTCTDGLTKFSTECFPPGFAEENLPFFERMGQDGVPVHAQGMLRLWDVDFAKTWGRLSFAEWFYADRLLLPSLHKSLSYLPSTGFERLAVNCPTCAESGVFIKEPEGTLEFLQGSFLSDTTCQWIFNRQLNDGSREFFSLHIRQFNLEPGLEYFESCKIGQTCQRYDSTFPDASIRVEAPFELFFHSQTVDLSTPSRQLPPNPANPWKFFIVFSMHEQLSEVELDWRTPLGVYQENQESGGNGTMERVDPDFKNNSVWKLGIRNGQGRERELPCGYQHTTASPHSVMHLDKVESNVTRGDGVTNARTELEGVWAGVCYPHVPETTATCQVDLRVEQDTFELTYFQCGGFLIDAYANGLIYQLEEVATDVVTSSFVHLYSYKKFSVQYTSGRPLDTNPEYPDLSTANGIFLWRGDQEFAPNSIEINLHRPAHGNNPDDFPGDNNDLLEQTKSCQILYLHRVQRSDFAIPAPRQSFSTVFFLAVKQQNLYLACNNSVTALMTYLDTTGCFDEIAGLLGTRQDYDSGDFEQGCSSGCLATYIQRLNSAVRSCTDAWSALQRDGPAEGVTDQIYHYLGGRMLFLASSKARSSTVCVGSYRNLTCNQLPALMPSVIAGACGLARVPGTLPSEIGAFPFTRYDLTTTLRTGCLGNCRERLETFMLLGHCCMPIMDAAQREWWMTMAPVSAVVQLDLAAYRCMYDNGPCDQSVSDPVTLTAPVHACGFSDSESWACAYGGCSLGLPAACCQPFPCRNGAWRESHGACYCRCVNSWTGADCGVRRPHVESALRFTESNMISWQEEEFLQQLANGLAIPRSNTEMGWINVIEAESRRIGRMQDTVEVGFRVLVDSDRDALRQAATLQAMQEQGTFAIVFGQSGFGTFADFVQAPEPRNAGGDVLCDDETFLCPDTIDRARGDGDDGFVLPPNEYDPAGAIAGGVVGGLAFCACCVTCVIVNREKLILQFEGRADEEKAHGHKGHGAKPKELTKKEKREKDIQHRIQRQKDQGYLFGFGTSTHDHERSKQIDRHTKIKFQHNAAYGDAHTLGRTGTYNTPKAKQLMAFKEALLLGAATKASDAAEHLQQAPEDVEEQRELDPGLSLKRIAAHQRMLAARLASMNGVRTGQENESLYSSAESQQQPRAAPVAYTYPDALMPNNTYPHEEFEETVREQQQFEAKQREDNVLALFERGSKQSTPSATPQKHVREISFVPAVVNFPNPSPTSTAGYLSASLVHPHGDDRNGNGAVPDADSLLNSSMAAPPLPFHQFEVPISPAQAGRSLGSNVDEATSFNNTLARARPNGNGVHGTGHRAAPRQTAFAPNGQYANGGHSPGGNGYPSSHERDNKSSMA